jgi:hypothetical protein
MSTFLSVAPYVALAGLAGAILAFGIEPARRVLRRRQPRPADQEPVHPIPATTPTRRLLLPALRQLVHPGRPTPGITALLDWQPPPPRPSAAVAHTGATEDFGRELRDLRNMPVAPELAPVLSEVEIRSEVHSELDAMMAAFRHDLDHILDGVCRRLDKHWARCDADTGQWDATELRAQLDAEDRLVTAC